MILIFCACDFFKKRGYCVHLAALEYYLKNDAARTGNLTQVLGG